ncbi:hypothetical protein WJX74_001036 [Apatococcus lobatus]|uniref:Ubiquitin-like domain-containing protein n=1 Tax=Apatococcus lobatus TaxID=904363 RepID=A0AAW1RAG0_9CHLO
MQIIVKGLTGQTTAVEVDSSDLVQDVKARLQQQAGCPPEQQRLMFGSKQLEDNKTLLDYNIQRESTIHVLHQVRGGGNKIFITLRPRLQKDKWSLYWKESMETKTVCLDDLLMDVDLDSTIEDLNKRLEGFTDPWEKSLLRGREVPAGTTLRSQGVATGDTIVIVRRELIAEAWQIVGEGNDTSSSDEDDAW